MPHEKHLANILVVDDDPITLELVQVELEEKGFRVYLASNLSEMRTRLKERGFDFIILDLFLGEENGLEAIPYLVRETPYTKVIVMSAHGTVELAVDALEKGAASFLCKSKEPKELVASLIQKLPKKVVPTVSQSEPLLDTGILGETQTIRDAIAKINQFKDIDSTVIVTGESGTGKELIARALHNTSIRKNGRFEAINCGAIPENLLESELFGYKKGAFTDAKTDRKGLFEICSGGTLFLDEIGEMPLALQVKLLRVLQEQEVTPIGGNQSIKIQTRIVTATNRDLGEEVKKGTFRADLFYRLNVLRIHLAPLRERTEDIAILTGAFLERFNRRFSKNVRPPSKELIARLNNHNWPGNIRELQNAVERGTVLSLDNDLHLEQMLDTETKSKIETSSKTGIEMNSGLWESSLSEAKKQFEKAYLQHLLEATGGNVSEVARISGRYRTDIYRLLNKYNMESDEFRE